MLQNWAFFLSTLILTIIMKIESSPLNSDGTKKPHIVFIMADDLGFNDVGFHGSAQISTPNIDALAYSGIILNQYYVNPICTPSRSALMTGKYPIHNGMQHTVLYGAEPRGLPLSEKLMPEYFNQLGYSSHLAGKWHLGHYKSVYTPLNRGFRSHVGFWTGHHDYFDHTAVESPSWGLDIRRGMQIAYDLHGKYSTDLITDEAVRVIRAHNATRNPLFLYVSHAAAHSGNPYSPLPAPDSTVDKMKHIENIGRRKYAAIVSKLDDSVGKIVEELHRSHMLNDSIIIFSTDNGGPAEGFNLNHASNWPLRGVKNTLWEGGVRGAALLWHPKLNKKCRVSDQMMHITDWLPTLLDAIDGTKALELVRNVSIDGLSLWNALSSDEMSPRKHVLHNIDDIWGSAAITVGDWKLLNGSHYGGAWDGWYGPKGIREPRAYDRNAVLKSAAGRVISSLNLMPSSARVVSLRQRASVSCETNSNSAICEPLKEMCLFNIQDDPCERQNLANSHPEILNSILMELQKYRLSAIPPSNKPLDPRGDPRLWQNTWTNFGDSEDYIKIKPVIGNIS